MGYTSENECKNNGYSKRANSVSKKCRIRKSSRSGGGSESDNMGQLKAVGKWLRDGGFEDR